jgi:hypothetical protein
MSRYGRSEAKAYLKSAVYTVFGVLVLFAMSGLMI